MARNRTEEDWFLRGGERPPKPEQPPPSPAETPPSDGSDPFWDLADDEDEDDSFAFGEVASPGGFGPL